MKSDRQLLIQFSHHKDENAFHDLVVRYTPMVWGICQRILNNTHDAEEACQATFTILAKKASSLRQPHKLGNWLYGVALRTAKKQQTMRIRRKNREKKYAQERENALSPNKTEAWQQISSLLDREIMHLPQKLQEVLIAYYFQRLTYRQTADQLQLTPATVRGRLHQARQRLRDAFATQGVSLSLPIIATTLTDHACADVATQKGLFFAKKALAAWKELTISTTTTHIATQTFITMNIKKTLFILIGITLLLGLGFTLYQVTQAHAKKESKTVNKDSQKRIKKTRDHSLSSLRKQKNRRSKRSKNSVLSLQEIFFLAPEERWELLQEMGITLSQEEVESIVNKTGYSAIFPATLLREWAKLRPKEALVWLVEQDTLKLSQKKIFPREETLKEVLELMGESIYLWAEQNPTEALSFIEENLGQDPLKEEYRNRCSLIAYPIENANAILEISDELERYQKWKILLEVWPPQKAQQGVDWANEYLEENERDYFLASLLKQLAQTDTALAKEILESLKETVYYEFALSQMAMGMDYSDPQEVLNLITPLQKKILRNGAIGIITRRWSLENEDQAIKWVHHLKNTPDFYPALRTLLHVITPEAVKEMTLHLLKEPLDENVEHIFIEVASFMNTQKPEISAAIISEILNQKDINILHSGMHDRDPETGSFLNKNQANLWRAVLYTARTLARSDHPQKAVEWLSTIHFATEEDEISILKGVIQVWARSEDQAARDWITQSELSYENQQLLLDQIGTSGIHNK